MSGTIDLSTLDANGRARLAGYNSLALLQALAAATVVDASGDETISGNLRRSVAVPAAAGSTHSNAAALTADLNAVTAANGTKGVILPASVAGLMVEVINTVTTAGLKVYPDSGGVINALSADAAFVVGPGRRARCLCSAAGQWYVADVDQGASTTAELNTLSGITSTTAELNQIHSQGAVTTDFAKLHAVTASAAEVNQLTSQGAVTTDFAKLHAITATAAELNVNASVTPGTTSASKTLVAGASSNLDTLTVATLTGTVAVDRLVRLSPQPTDTYSGTMTIDVTYSMHVVAGLFATSATVTYTPSAAGSAGDILIIRTASGAGGTVTATFASTFHSSGTQATTTGTFSTIVFVSDGTRWCEIARTTALA